MNLRDFIAARLDEDAAAAEATSQDYDSVTTWKSGKGSTGRHWWVQNNWSDGVVATDSDTSEPAAVVAHIARHDPARVLRQVGAMRLIVEEHCIGRAGWNHTETGCSGCGGDTGGDDRYHFNVAPEDCETLQALAAIYSDHPDYRQEWTA